MAKPKRGGSGGWTASQVVAHNLTQARELRGLTQAEIAERLTKFTGTSWSAVTVAQAEGSVSGNRIRQFTANELVALARTFDLPLVFFFIPPEDGTGWFRIPDRGGIAWEYLLLLLWGHEGNFPYLADHAAPWAHASTMTVPFEDLLDRHPDTIADIMQARRGHLRPDDMLAVAFNGLARRRIRGSPLLSQEPQKFAENLRALADMIEGFANYPPGAFFDEETLRKVLRIRQPPENDIDDDIDLDP